MLLEPTRERFAHFRIRLAEPRAWYVHLDLHVRPLLIKTYRSHLVHKYTTTPCRQDLFVFDASTRVFDAENMAPQRPNRVEDGLSGWSGKRPTQAERVHSRR